MFFPDLVKRGALTAEQFATDTWDQYVYSGVHIVQEPSGLYRLFYTAYGSDVDNDYGPATALSADLDIWTKPNVGRIIYGGNTNNNLIMLRDVATPTPLELADVIWAEGQYVALTHNKANAESNLWSSPDGEDWTYVQGAFIGDGLGNYAEPKAILYDGSTYKLFYQSQNVVVERRSIGYYEAATIDGSFVDQGHRPEFVSTDQDLQYYDMHCWQHVGVWWAVINLFNLTTEVLGPHVLYKSTDNGETWVVQRTILDNGGVGEFDEGLIALGKPVLVGNIWNYLYVGSEDTHDIWPRPMDFAWATGLETGPVKTLHHNFAASKSLAGITGPALSCTRALNTATQVNASGLIETVNANIGRFDHDPLTLACRGLLVEQPRTNLLLQSNDLTTTWLPWKVTVDANVAVAPDGNTTMDRINVTAEDNSHFVYQIVTVAVGSNYAYSAYIKDDGAGFAALTYYQENSNYITVVANLTTGVVTDTEEGSTSGTIVDSGVEDIGGGIYRVWIVGSVNQDTTGVVYISPSESGTPTYDSSGRPTYLATAGADILVWGAQFELGYNRSSLIPTTTTTLLRNRDVISTTDMSWYNEAAGTMYFAGSNPTNGSLGSEARALATVSDNTTANRFYWGQNLANTAMDSIPVAAGVLQDNLMPAYTWAKNTIFRAVRASQANDHEHYVNGVRGGTGDQVFTQPTGMTHLYVGSRYGGGPNVFHGHIEEIRYYDERLANDVLAAMSLGTFPSEGGSGPGAGLGFGKMGHMGLK